jgi:hypothetical protein
MSLVTLTDLGTIALLATAFLMLWRERRYFTSLAPILSAIVFIAIGRLCDTVLEHQDLHLTDFFGLSQTSFDLLFTVAGNISDVIGISFLIVGFVRMIKFQKSEEEHIQGLEALLPICSNCKNYRTPEGVWLPIEKYLIESGSPRLTHGLCPDCVTKLYGVTFKSKT